MEKNTYARLLHFATTKAGKLVSILVAAAMVYSLTAIAYAVDEAVEAFGSQEAEEQAVPTEVTVHVLGEHCTVNVNGQPVSGNVVVTPDASIAIDVVPDEGYLLGTDSISIMDELGVAVYSQTDDASYVVEAADVFGGNLYITVSVVLDQENQPQDNDPSTIGEDTNVTDGQIQPAELLPAPTIVLEDVVTQYSGLPVSGYTAQATVEGLLEGDEMRLVFDDASITDVGTAESAVVSYEILRGGFDGADVTGEYEAATLPVVRLTVEPAPLYVKTPSAVKSYDGDPLVYEGSIEEGDAATVGDFWGNEEVAFRLTGSQTEVGQSFNTYEMEWISGNPANYQIFEELGVLEVLPAEEVVYAIAPSASKTYDGKPIDAGPVLWSGLPEGYTAQAEYSGATTDTSVVVTSVLEESVRIFDVEGADVTSNFQVETVDGELVVEPATLYVFTESASKSYDGTALTAAGAVTGYVNGETATFTVTGSQLGAGSSVNGYRIDWDGTANQANYLIEEDLGTLQVVAAPVQEAESDNGNTDNGNTGNGNNGNGGSGTTDAGSQPNPVPEQPTVVYEQPTVVYEQVPAANTAAVSTAANAASAVAAGTSASSSEGEGVASRTNDNDANGANGADEGAAEGSGLNPVVEAVATGMQNLEQMATGEEPTGLVAPATEEAAEEEILEDDATPLGVFDEPVKCWVHWYAILGLIATAIYGAVVMFFRRAYAYELETREASVLGVPVSTLQPQVPASTGGQAGKEA